jgi:hypothetical protein
MNLKDTPKDQGGFTVKEFEAELSMLKKVADDFRTLRNQY